MYSVVLMAAIATATSGQGFCHRSHGCSNCYSCYSSCSSYCSYSGYSCYSGYSGYSCHGYGSTGGHHGPVLYGCAGPNFGYHGGCYSAFGIYADAYNGGTGCYGCHGGHSGYGYPVPFNPQAQPQVGGVRDPFPPIDPEAKKPQAKEEEVPAPKEKGAPKINEKAPVEPKKADPNEKKKAQADEPKQEGVRAKVRIHVPQGGQLFVDGNVIRVAPGIRVFQTPPLVPGERYYYDIRIDQNINGELLSDSRRVIIEPGQDVAVDFQNRDIQTARNGR